MLSEEQPQPSQEEEKHHLAPTEAAIAHHSQIEITTRTPFNPVNEQLIDDFVGSLPEIVESEEQLKQIIRGMKRESRYHPLTSKENLKRIADHGRGIVVYLREGSVGVGRQAARRLEATGQEAHAEAQTREEEWLEIGLGAQILKDLNTTSIRLLASKERHYVGLEGFGIEISSTEIME